MTVALVVFAVFAGIAVCVGVVGAAILVADGKLTLPNTNERRVRRAAAETQIAEMALQRERVQTMTDAQIELRLTQALRRALPEGDSHE